MRLIFLIFVFVFATFSVKADDVAASEVKKVIESQLEAFSADDIERAYSFAAPRIKSIFPNAEIFAQMVRQGYSPIYRPGPYQFGEVEVKGKQISQSLRIEGLDGRFYEAEYILSQQSTGEWKISAVFLKQLEDLSS